MNFVSTVKGSALEGFYPEGWDFEKIEKICGAPTGELFRREKWWNKDFSAVPCKTLSDFEVMLGYEIAEKIELAGGKKIAFILPVGPMGMYRWMVYFLRKKKISCKNVYTFNMDEWADGEGNTLDGTDRGSFRYAMEQALFLPLEELTVPPEQRNFATRENLPSYPAKIAELKKQGAELVLVYGIGRMCHIAFWEPTFAKEYATDGDWKKAEYRLGARLHPLTVEQNALTSFKSRTGLVPCRANTVGPGLFLQADCAIGGADGCFGRGMQWQGMSLRMTLKYGPTRWVTSSYIPTLPGRLFYLEELAAPLEPECN